MRTGEHADAVDVGRECCVVHRLELDAVDGDVAGSRDAECTRDGEAAFTAFIQLQASY